MHQTQLRPLFGDVDAMNVVYYGNYLRFFERGRAELMRAAGGTYAELERQGMHLPVTEAALRYKSPARYDDLVTVATSVPWLKKASLQFDYLISVAEPDGTVRECVSGFTKHGCVDKSGRVRPLPGWVVEALRKHLAT